MPPKDGHTLLAMPLVERSAAPRRLTLDDAVDIWIARWLRIRITDLRSRYGCDTRRLYEIWWEQKFIGSRERARAVFLERFPTLAERTDFGYRRHKRGAIDEERQPSLFAQQP